MRIGVYGEISRHGGGQYYMKSLIEALHPNNISLIAGIRKDPLNIISLVNNIIPVNYYYQDEENILKVIFSVLSLKRQIANINIKFDLTINNHPNIFIKNADINILHGFSFLDRIINYKGDITNKFIFHAIKLSRLYKEYNNSNFVVNSSYTKNISERLFPKLGLKYRIIGVLYPTFNMKSLMSTGNKILLFGRINRRKNIDNFLKIANEINGEIIVAGAVNSDDDEKYLKNLEKISPGNVKFMVNPTDSQKEEIFMDSSVYIHTAQNENFGITVLEAMSHGIVPIVPKSGGPWLDIINEGEFGLGYSNTCEIPGLIDMASRQSYSYRKEIMLSVGKFSPENYRKTLMEIIDRV